MQFKQDEEKWEKKVEETLGQKATASDPKAAKVDKSLATDNDDLLDMPNGMRASFRVMISLSSCDIVLHTVVRLYT